MASNSKRVNNSSVWDHMEKLKNGKVECRLCKKQLCYSGCSTTSLLHHLKAMHQGVVDVRGGAGDQAQRPLTSFGVDAPRHCSESRQERINELLMKVIISNMLPLSLVDSDEFREFMNFVEPNCRVPCRQTVTARLDSMRAKLGRTVSEKMLAASAVHMTTDIWSSCTNDAYIGVTAAYVSPEWH